MKACVIPAPARQLRSPSRSCTFVPAVGLVLNLGNGLVKVGQVDAARVMYANAIYAANYETWPYRDVLEAIAASDLNARAALYAPDANRKNAPPLNVPNRSCVYCHATVPESAAR